MKQARTIQDLRYFQSLPLESKVALTKSRIREWYNYFSGKVYVSFSGGKDSTVLLHIAREIYPQVKAVFVNTGLEFPEIVKFVTTFENIETIRPKQTFSAIVEDSGYPLFSKEVSETIRGAKKYINDLVEREMGFATEYGELRNAPYMADVVGIDRRNDSKTKNPPFIALKDGVIPSEILFTRSSSDLNSINYKRDNSDFRFIQETDILNNTNTKGRSLYSKEKFQFALFSPFDISNRCCRVLKKSPIHIYWSRNGYAPITAQLAEESMLRKMHWLHNGCNLYEGEFPISNPMSFWTEQDVLQYIHENGIQIASVYGNVAYDDETGLIKTTGCERTGCFACLFGAHLEKGNDENRFVKVQKNSNPKLVDWMLRGGSSAPLTGNGIRKTVLDIGSSWNGAISTAG